jgi:hypothetical protein
MGELLHGKPTSGASVMALRIRTGLDWKNGKNGRREDARCCALALSDSKGSVVSRELARRSVANAGAAEPKGKA